MSRIASLALLTTEGGKEYLAELYGKTIEGVQKALVSASMKNVELSGDPTSGSVEAKRFANASPKPYGTARAAGAGEKVKAKPVVVQIDTDREIVEELEEKDVRLYGVDGVLDRRSNNHILRMAAEMDNKFFSVAGEAAVAVNMSGYASVDEELEAIIQECETTQNDFVDGVPRSVMNLVLSPAYYGKIRLALDKQANNANVDTAAAEFYTWHGVKAKSSVHLGGLPYILMVDGAVAQPAYSDQYKAEKVPLSDATAVELFYHYGTEAVTPDLIFRPGVFTEAETYKAGTQYYTKGEDGKYTPVEISSFAPGTTYYTMG